jgi:hypothetical protein
MTSTSLATLAVSIALVAGLAAAPPVHVLTNRNDAQRSGVTTHETALTQNAVAHHFGKLWTLFSDAQIMAQPLYVSGLASAPGTRCAAGCNAVIFASMKGTVYTYMADVKPATVNDTLIWARYVGDPRDGGDDIDMWATNDPWWGILGTPVIDLPRNLLYTVVWNKDQQYRLYALDLSTGAIKRGPTVVNGTVDGIGFAHNGQGFKQQRKQRAALLLDRDTVYVAFGGDNKHALAGWLFAYDVTTFALRTVWSPTPGGDNGGIWQSGQGPSADADGNVFLQTGDGEFDPGKQRYANSAVKLRLETAGGGQTIVVKDSFTPCHQAFLSACDIDLGSAGPLLFGDHLLLSGGKSGWLYLMRATQLGGHAPGPHLPQAHPCGFLPDCADTHTLLQKFRGSNGHIHGSPVFWAGPNNTSWLYLAGEGDPIRAIPFGDGTFNMAARKQSAWKPGHPEPPPCGGPTDNWMPGGVLTVSSDERKPGTGIVWALVPANGDANSYRGIKGMLLALDAEKVGHELWRSQSHANPAVDTANSFGLLSRFTPPTVANGKVFVATSGDREPIFRYCGQRPTRFPDHYQLVVYGLK